MNLVVAVQRCTAFACDRMNDEGMYGWVDGWVTGVGLDGWVIYKGMDGWMDELEMDGWAKCNNKQKYILIIGAF